MPTVSAKTSINIKATPEDVFAYLKNLKYWYYWNPSLRMLSHEGELEEGMAYESESVVLKDIVIKNQNVVTKLIPNKEIDVANNMGTVKFDSSITLTNRSHATMVVCRIDVLTESKAFGLTLPVLKQLAKRELQTDLQALKIAVENKLGQ